MTGKAFYKSEQDVIVDPLRLNKHSLITFLFTHIRC